MTTNEMTTGEWFVLWLIIVLALIGIVTVVKTIIKSIRDCSNENKTTVNEQITPETYKFLPANMQFIKYYNIPYERLWKNAGCSESVSDNALLELIKIGIKYRHSDSRLRETCFDKVFNKAMDMRSNLENANRLLDYITTGQIDKEKPINS